MNINTSLRIAVALVLGTAMPEVMAAGITDPVKVANEEADFTSADYAGAVADFNVPVMGGKTISSTAPYFVVITLKEGAKFTGNNVTLKCNYATGADVLAVADTPAAAAGGTVAAFKLESGSTYGQLTASTCKLSFASPAFTLASGKKDYGISVVSRHLDPSESVSATQSGTLVTFTQGLQLSTSAGEVTVDVTSPSLSKYFQSGGTVQTDLYTANLGLIRYAGVEGVNTISAAVISTNEADAISKYLSSVTIMVSGAPLAAVQTTAATPLSPIAKAGIFLSNTIDCSDSAAGALINASGVQATFTVPAAKVAAGADINVCMLANGISIIDRGIVSFTISAAADGTHKPNVGIVDPTLSKVVKNGTSIKVLNVPGPTNTERAFIRFYNMGTFSGKVFGTLYGTDGKVIGTPSAMLIDSLAKESVKMIDSVGLAKALGVSETVGWPGRAWLQIESEIKGLRVQALVRSGGGTVLMNMSDRVIGDDELNTHR